MDKTYKDALMYKEAGLGKLVPNLLTRIAMMKRFKPLNQSAAKSIPYLLGGLGKDVAANGKVVGKGGLKLLKWYTDPLKGSAAATIGKEGLGDLLSRVGRGARRTAILDLIPTALSSRWRKYQWDTLKAALSPVANTAGENLKNQYQKVVEYLNDTKNGVGTRVVAGPHGSKASLFNPVSGLTGGVDWVPQKYIDFVQKYIPGQVGATTAHMTAKAGAMALLAAGLVGGYRTLRHVKDLGTIEAANRPGKNLSGQLSTTFAGDLSGEEDKQEKAASIKTAQDTAPVKTTEILSPGNFTTQNLTATALPIGTFLLAAGLAYKGVDSVFDKIRNKRLDRAIAEKDKAIKKLITARAQIAKGGQNIEDVNAAVAPIADKDIYTKAASQDKIAVIPETVQLVGTLSAAVLLASAIGSYAYTAAGDEDNLKYKAYKKALREYAKAKSGITPITVAPKNAPSYFSAIDAAGQKEAPTARQLPAIDTDALNKPISISI